MQWIKTWRQLGQAVKNVQRLRQITGVLAKYGFVDIIERMRLGKFLPTRFAQFAADQADRSIPERLRLAFEELGPTFVKLGQLLSTRPDVFPESFIDEFVKLQDNVQPLPFEIVKTIVEKQLDRPIPEAFSELKETPLAAASIGQVHEATLRTGEKVVIKVQRPEIRRIIETDVSILAFIAGLLEKYVPETRVVNPHMIVDEFFRTLSFELDFKIEANNMLRMSENLKDFPEIIIPKVYKDLSTRKILVLEKLEGIPANNIGAIEAAHIDKKRLVEIGARAFFKSVMIDGLFHGDMHGGNLLIIPGPQNPPPGQPLEVTTIVPGAKLGIIDFGIVGRLSQRSRDQLANMVMAIISEDFENLCYTYAELGAANPSIDFDGFQREVRNNLSPLLGLSIGEINAGQVLVESTRIAAKYHIQVPGEWMLVFKAILTMEGLGRTLDPDFDLLALGQDMVKDLVKNQYSPQRLSKELMWVTKDVSSLLQVLPRQIRWMFRKFNSNDFAFEIKSPDLHAIRDEVDQHGRRTSLSIVIAGFFVAGAIALQDQSHDMLFDYPLLALVFFAAGLIFLMTLLLKSFK